MWRALHQKQVFWVSPNSGALEINMHKATWLLRQIAEKLGMAIILHERISGWCQL